MAKKIKKEIIKEDKPVEAYNPTGTEYDVLTFIEKRIPVLKKSRQGILNDGDGGFDFDKLMQDADREYVPHNLKKKDKSGSVYLELDETLGIRGSRIVPITGTEGNEWRSDISEPTLFVKVNTALSILMQQNPEATFKATLDKYKPTSALAKAIWKRSWDIACSREQMQYFISNLAKYGWAPGRTHPRIVKRSKDVLIELDTENPEKNKYETRTIVDFNDVWREALDPHRTWIDDMANLTDPWSLNDWYFEKDYDKDTFDREFSNYSNYGKISAGAPYREGETDKVELNEETKTRDDVITLGFYENFNKDLYVIYCPKDKVVLYQGPLPNDDGLLSYWDAYWNLRDPRTRYGVGLYEILKNDKVMYDRWDNMTTDQLIMAVYKMLFYSGPSAPGDGTIRVQPGVAKQKLPGTTIETVDVKFEPKAFEWLDRRQEKMDENTGITPTLQGQVEGKTLGEVLHAKDAALKRLNIPLANIAYAIEKDAYLTLSWANQMYSLPEVMDFTDEKQLAEFMSETGRDFEEARIQPDGKISADFPRSLDLSLEEDREGNLIESPDQRFFVIGQDVAKKAIKWKGRVTVKATSIVSPSPELERQRKLELYNIVTPIVQAITQALAQGMYNMALGMSKPVVQILEIQDEKPEDWLPDEVVQMLNNPDLAKTAEANMKVQQAGDQPLLIDPNAPPEQVAGSAPGSTPGQSPGLPQTPSEKGPSINPVSPSSMPDNSVKRSMASTLGAQSKY